MPTIVFGQHEDNLIFLNNNDDTIIVRLPLPVGSYVIIGKTVLSNNDGHDPQNAMARLTTMDGATVLDRADIRINQRDDADNGAQEVSLQAVLELTNDTPDRIVDLRAQSYSGGAQQTKLYAIQVDALKVD
jgi:hypothetical protein